MEGWREERKVNEKMGGKQGVRKDAGRGRITWRERERNRNRKQYRKKQRKKKEKKNSYIINKDTEAETERDRN